MGRFWVAMAALVLAGCTDADVAEPDDGRVAYEFGDDTSQQRLRESFRSAEFDIPENATKGEQLAIVQNVLAQARTLLELEVQQQEDFLKNGVTNLDQAAIDAMKRTFDRLLDENGDTIIAVYGEAYEEVLTEAEMDAAIKFLSTPEGQSFNNKTPDLMSAGMRAMQSMNPVIESLMAEEMSR